MNLVDKTGRKIIEENNLIQEKETKLIYI